MTLFLLSALAFAADPPMRPELPQPVVGQCDKNYGLTKGQPLPSNIVDESGSATCSAVVVPLSDYADLLVTEDWAKLLAKRYQIDTVDLERETDWYKSKLEEANQPIPWMERPSTQRWLGRMETILIVGVVSVGLASAYSYGAGVMK